MAIVTGDRYLESLVQFVDRNAGQLLDGSVILKMNPMGLQYVQSRLDALHDLEGLVAVDYLRAYVSDLGDHRALEQLRRILGLLPSLKVISTLPGKARDPTPISIAHFGRLKVLELRGCDLSTSSAKGLLELRHTLEKLICHNSTDALKHVFAGRIADIKDCSDWTKLTFVSCACNDMVLMDESLTLLPVVETLDLSRNEFARVDNLKKCTKLQQLDLGFNHLQSITSLIEVQCQIVKLILRNNALTTLRGLENLKSLEGLDLSYNIISSFTELEILTSLPSIQDLWLEGNPICYARWYRVHVFSFFSNPEKLKLDGKEISTGEYWERHVIFASRQKKPPGLGFYFPAKDVTEEDDNSKGEKKKYSRIASIEDEAQGRYAGSDAPDHGSSSSHNEDVQNVEPAKSDGNSKIVSFMDRVESMKKEKSVLWLREYKELMDQSSEDDKASSESTSIQGKERHLKQRKGLKLLHRKLKHVPTTAQVSESVYSSNSIEANVTFSNTYFGRHDNESSNGVVFVEQLDSPNGYVNELVQGTSPEQGKSGGHPYELEEHSVLGKENYSNFNEHSEAGWQVEKVTKLVPSAIQVPTLGSDLSPTNIRSPPHYQEDLLHRRLYLEEEFLQLSTEPQTVEPSDSDTSCSDSTSCELNSSSSDVDEILVEISQEKDSNKSISGSLNEDTHYNRADDRLSKGNKMSLSYSYSGSNRINTRAFDTDTSYVSDMLRNGGSGALHKQKVRGRVKRRAVSVLNDTDACEESLGRLDHRDSPLTGCSFYSSNLSRNTLVREYIKEFFHLKIADSTASEICQEVVLCRSMLELEASSEEREVAIVWSSQKIFYILLVDATSDSLDITCNVLRWHRLADIKEVVVGLGLQTLRVFLEGGPNYLFLTRNSELSKDLLYLLQFLYSTQISGSCSLKSWETVQVKLLEKCVGRSLEMGVLIYSMLFFWDDTLAGKTYVARSLFVLEGCLLVCIENLADFGSFTDDYSLSHPYYSVDSSSSIQNILEMVIELTGNILTMKVKNPLIGVSCLPVKCHSEKHSAEPERVATWKLKWFSEDALLKFVALVKAIHSGISSPLLTTYV